MPKTLKFIIACCTLSALAAATPAQAGEGDVVAVLKLKGPLAEQPDAMGLGALLGEYAPA